MLQQQHAQLTIKRAASGVMEGVLLPITNSSSSNKRHSGGPAAISLLSGSGLGLGAAAASAAVDSNQQPEASGLSSSGLRRAMLSIKSVTATPLSTAAKTSIINTIADNALASFVVIQVCAFLCGEGGVQLVNGIGAATVLFGHGGLCCVEGRLFCALLETGACYPMMHAALHESVFPAGAHKLVCCCVRVLPHLVTLWLLLLLLPTINHASINQVAITVSRVLKGYSKRADLNARMPGFRVNMGFGLHVGWAIEGAIGEGKALSRTHLWGDLQGEIEANRHQLPAELNCALCAWAALMT